MNKLDVVFQSGKKNLLNIYCTAGYPFLNSTREVILALQKNGADMVEIGMPYSDPIADGAVIQESNKIALQNGMNMQLLFEQLEEIKQQVQLPVILMGYFNPVLQFGIEKFCYTAASAGVSAVIIPDLPLYEYEHFYKQVFMRHNLYFIFLVTPETPVKRLKKADSLSNGFLYVVSSSSTTGQNAVSLQDEYLKKLNRAKLKNSLLIGFGIKDKETFQAACTYSKGAIIGSAYISTLKNSTDIDLDTKNFISSVVN